MEGNQIVTIDLGTKTIRLDVANVVDGEKIEVIYHNDFPSAGISHGKVVNPSKLGAVLRNAVSAAENFLSIRIEKVLVGCQKCDIKSIDKTVCLNLNESDKVTAETLDALKDLACDETMSDLDENETILTATAQCFNAGDEFGVPAEDLEGMMVEHIEGKYKIFTGRTISEKQVDAAFREAGVDHIKPVFFGSEIGEAILSKNELENGAAIIDMGAGATAVYIFHSGVLRHFASIPFGGNSISSDIRFLCDIDEGLAENIKLGYGGCMPEKLESLGEKTLRIKDIDTGNQKEVTAKYLSEIISARAKEIIEAILYEIQESGYADKLKNGIVLTGGCAPTLNLCHYIKQLSGYNARLGCPSPSMFRSDSKLFRSPSSATTAALLLCGAKHTQSFIVQNRHVGIQPGAQIKLPPTEEKPVATPTAEQETAITGERSGLFGLIFDSLSNDDENGKKKKEQEKTAAKEARKAAKEAKKQEKEARKAEKEARKKEQSDNESGGLFGSILGKVHDELFKEDDI